MSANPTLEIELARDCEAIVIPHGYRTQLTRGTRVRSVQELGGSMTVSAEFGGLFRIDPENYDALGLEAKPQEDPDQAARKPFEERIWDTLRTCYDPEIPVNIVELGLIYDCTIGEPDSSGRHPVAIQMTLTAPGCGMGDVLAQDIKDRLERMPDVSATTVEVVFDPPWNQEMMSEAARLQLGFF